MNTKPCKTGGRWGIERQWTAVSITRRNFKISVTVFFSVKFCNNVGKVSLGLGMMCVSVNVKFEKQPMAGKL